MANYDSNLTGAQINAALSAITGLISGANNGKVITVENGLLVAKSVLEIQGGTLSPLTVTANGTYTPEGNLDGYRPVTVNVSPGSLSPLTITSNGIYSPPSGSYGISQVTVNVSGGGSTAMAVAIVTKRDGYVCTATQGSYELSSPTSGEQYIFCLPTTGSWTFACSGKTVTSSFNTYEAKTVIVNDDWDLFETYAADLRLNGTSSQYYSSAINKIGNIYDVQVNSTAAKAILIDVLHTSTAGDTGEALTFMLCGSNTIESSQGNITIYPYLTATTLGNFPSGEAYSASVSAVQSLSFYNKLHECSIYYCVENSKTVSSVNTKAWIWSLNEVGLPDGTYHSNTTGNLFKILGNDNKYGQPFNLTVTAITRTRTAPNNATNRSYTIIPSFSRQFSTSISAACGCCPMFSF